MALCRHLGFEEGPCRRAMEDLRPDLADFCLLPLGSARLAFAFSANDLTTTEELLGSLGWDRAGTEILYNHRADRTDRLRSFQDWMLGRWKAVHVIGHRPPAGPLSSHYVPLKSPEELALFLKDRGNILGCGNAVYGLPLRLKLALEEGRLSI